LFRKELATTEKQRIDDSDYEYGYDYLYEDEQRPQKVVPFDTDDEDDDEIPVSEKALLDILAPLPPPEIEDERKKLKRELQEEALRRMEEAARTEAEFKCVVSMWNKRDDNRERKERYHEISRGDTPLEYGLTSTYDALIFPKYSSQNIISSRTRVRIPRDSRLPQSSPPPHGQDGRHRAGIPHRRWTQLRKQRRWHQSNTPLS